MPGSRPRMVQPRAWPSTFPRSRQVSTEVSTGLIIRTGPGTYSGLTRARIGTANRLAPNPMAPWIVDPMR